MAPRTKLAPRRADPADINVQVTIRIPFWYREQLIAEADALHVAPSALIVDAVQRIYPPKRPAE